MLNDWQALCSVVQHHMQLIKHLQRQMWSCLGGAAEAATTTVLLGLQQQYMRTASAMLSIAAPCSITGTQSCHTLHVDMDTNALYAEASSVSSVC